MYPHTGDDHIRMTVFLTPEHISAFRETIYSHFRADPRQLPWRGTGDPYRILVSEVMLQQTQAHRIGKDWESTMKALR